MQLIGDFQHLGLPYPNFRSAELVHRIWEAISRSVVAAWYVLMFATLYNLVASECLSCLFEEAKRQNHLHLQKDTESYQNPIPSG